MKTKLSLFLLLLCFTIKAQIKIDSVRYKHALKVAKTNNIAYLASLLKVGSKNDKQTVETFFYWIHQNIGYDLVMKNKKDAEKDTSVKNTMKTQKTICDGYCNLFEELCQAVKIECVKITGNSLQNDDKLLGDHAWNAVKIDNDWLLLDSTWGAGGINEKNVYQKLLNLDYLFSNPEVFILEHYPETEKWQFLTKPITKTEFTAPHFTKKRMLFFNGEL